MDLVALGVGTGIGLPVLFGVAEVLGLGLPLGWPAPPTDGMPATTSGSVS